MTNTDIEKALDQAFCAVFTAPVQTPRRAADPAKWIGDSIKWQRMVDMLLLGSTPQQIAAELDLPEKAVERFQSRYAAHIILNQKRDTRNEKLRLD